MTTLVVQFLEHASLNATPEQIRKRLRQAFDLRPISTVILGWDLRPQLEDAVAEEMAYHAAMLYRWHPLLASIASFALLAD